ncbi:hypothetical protein BJ742DRAFT_25243 [Cladochytrium replicatum]|nr:hypothetical protein BJ742DRAFT_25243 [Cladochytrium replicatum]
MVLRVIAMSATLTLERAEIAAHDEDCDGFITEPELAEYIGDLLPKLHVGQMSENYVRFYLCTATRKFFFFLDPLKLRKIKIERIVLSPIMTELMSLKDEPLSPTSISANWFSSVSTFRLYYQFLELDSDKSGLLDQAELSEYCPTMTSVFIDRVFQEHQTFRGQMDFGNFLDFVLAHENQDTPEAMAYFFKILDINGMGGLDHFTVRYFFKAVNDKMLESGYEPVYVEDVTNEIFDMARPKNEDFITLEDLQKCGCGSTIITMLSDSRGFYLYDNRESIDPSSDDA